jgi:polyhydroxybutyrate depolymerase
MRRLIGLIVGLVGLIAPVASVHAACAIGAAGATQAIDLPGLAAPILLHRPESDRSRALVLLLHGTGGDGATILRKSGMVETADANDFMIVAPDGGIPLASGGFGWAIPGVPTATGKEPAASDRDDVAFLTAIADRLIAAHCVDPARVYVAGFSGGARMASWLGCVAADRIAAIAAVAGLRAGWPLASDPQRPDPASCRPQRALPIITFAGDADTENPIEGGGEAYWRYSMAAAVTRWAALDGCAPKPQRHAIDAAHYEDRFTGCRAGSAIAVRMTRGGSHKWLADSAALWTFLSRHRLPPTATPTRPQK